MKWISVTGSRSRVISVCSPLMLLLIAAIAGIFLIVSNFQQAQALTTVPTKMNFQGRLTDASGNIKPNGTYNMKLRLFTVSSAGSAVWTEDRLVSASQGVTVTNGLFSIKLGDITTLPANLFASGDLYLEVELPTPATATTSSPTWTEGPMSPRNQLATSAYAYNAETLDGLDSEVFARTDLGNTFTGSQLFNIAAGSGSLQVTDGINSIFEISSSALGNYLGIEASNGFSISSGSPTTAESGFEGAGDYLYGYAAGSTTFATEKFSIQSWNSQDLLVVDNVASRADLYVDTTIASGKSLTVTGGATGTRPASPTEGMIYFDTTTKQLLTYSNGKWQADRSTATKIVAASNSSQAAKDAADYVADGENSSGSGTGTIDGDQVQINAALTAAAGGKVYLMEGTYTIDAGISVPNNTTLAGAGPGTVIQLGNFGSTSVSVNAITNTDTTTGTGAVVQDLKLEGRRSINTVGTQRGISFTNMGGGSGSTARAGAKLTNLVVANFNNHGINFSTSNNNTLMGNTVQGNDFSGIIVSGDYNTFTGNTVQGNNTYGIGLSFANNNTFAGNTVQASVTGFAVSSSHNNTFTGNTVQGNNSSGFSITSSNSNTISGNTLTDNGGSTNNNAISLSGSDSNNITGNTITDTSASSTNYAINITNSTSDTNYLAGNTLGGGSVRDLGTGTIYGGQVDASGNFVIQPAGNINLNKNTTVSAGTLTLGSTSQQGSLVVHDGNGQTATIRVADIAGNYTYTIPVTTGNDIFCMQTLANCGGAGSGVTTVGVLDGGTENANGATIVGNTIYLQSASPTSAGLMTTEAQSFTGEKTFGAQVIIQDTLTVQTELNVTPGALSTFAGDVFIINGASLNIWGGATGTRPASPTEGMIYFDTTTKQLITYSNGKWQADRSTSTKIVAASNSSQAAKDAADYVADGNGAGAGDGDQVQINAALTAAAGGKVYLMEGTYVADATILIPNNTILAGAGNGTVIELGDLDVTENLIENTDTTTGTGITIQDLKIDGRKDLNTAGTQHGIQFFNMGDVPAARKGSEIANVSIVNFRNYGLYLLSSDSSTIKGLYVYSNTTGINVSGSNNTINSSFVGASSSSGVLLGGTNNTISSSTVTGSTITGIVLSVGSTENQVVNNQVQGNGYGIEIDGNNNIVANNRVHDNGGATTNYGILVQSADSNSITGNVITDTSATTTNYAIHISSSASDNNYLADNTLGGGTINDLGTGTIYANQLNSSNTLVNRAAGGLAVQNTAGTNLLYANSSTSAVSVTGTLGVTSDSATAFLVQNSSSAPLFTVDSANNQLKVGQSDTTGVLLVLDTKTNAGDPTGVNGAMYYNSNLGKFRCYQGGAWTDCIGSGGPSGGQTRKITLAPEYPGAVLNGTGTGSMTADFDSTNNHNYYAWTSSQGTLNDYNVVTRTALPSEYASGFGTFKLWVYNGSTSTSSNDIQVTIKDASGTACASAVSVIHTSTNTWSEKTVTTSGCTFAANDVLTISIKLRSASSNAVRIGEMSYQYTN